MSELPPNSECPDAAVLRALLEDTLPDDQQATTQAHVDRCSTCEASLRKMTAGGESWIGMAEKLKSGSDEDPKLAAALERLKADDGSGGESNESTVDLQRTLDFLQPVDDPKLLGKLGQHEISEVVGWGGMGVVLKAYDPSLHRVVAVKVLASHLAHHAVARKRFIREAQAAAAVCHDNVVTIHAIDEAKFVVPPLGGSEATEQPPKGGTTNSLPKIVMQFVAGGSLQERIDQEAPLELKEILRIAMQTAAGLAAAHAQGVVHRDVKPANILLENGVQRVKLTDFGLARVMDDASLTLSGVIAGTPQYMAPEQAWGRDVDARADLFSLGAVMYAMCSGHSPFRARTTMAVLKRVCEDAPRPLRAINPDVPDWLVAIIEKLLAKNPDDRFQSATEVSELLAKWLAHVQQPTVASAPQFVVPSSGEIREPARTVSGALPPKGGTTNESSQLSPKVVVVAMAITTILLAFLSISVLEENSRNLASFLGFSVVQLLATFAMAGAFRAAWNTSRWLTWIAVLLFLPFMASFFTYATSNQNASGVMQFVGGLQALTALAFEFTLLFVRPMFPSDLNKPRTARLSGRRRLITAVCIVLVALSASWLLIKVRTQEQGLARAAAERDHYRQQAQIVQLQQLENARLRELQGKSDQPLGTQPFPKPTFLSTMPGMASGSMMPPTTEQMATTPEVLKPLLGRWVVVSIEGALLSTLSNNPTGTAIGGAPPGMAAGADMVMAGGMGGGSSLGPSGGGQSAPLQWIEFANGSARTFDGREANFVTEFDVTQEPMALQLRPQPETSLSVGRSGIFRLERDRLILCWVTPGHPLPTEFDGNAQGVSQLLVLRREWKPSPDFDPTKTPPPRAVIPFTADEAKRYQEAWARTVNVPVETTNSIGMKLRLLPAGAFDLAGIAMLRDLGAETPSVLPQPSFMATHEVTVAQFRKFVEATGYKTSSESSPLPASLTWRSPGIEQDSDQHPVVRVSWQDANEFCRWLSETEHEKYRLPTFVEWTFAAQAGLASGSRNKPPSNARLKFFDTTAPVGEDTANLFGLHDLFGNVSEWSRDLIQEPSRLSFGGSFRNATKNTGSSSSMWLIPRLEEGVLTDDIGFRVVREIQPTATKT